MPRQQHGQLLQLDALSPQERARTYELEAALHAEMGDEAPPGRVMVDTPGLRLGAILKGGSEDEVNELAALQLRGDGYAVYLSPP